MEGRGFLRRIGPDERALVAAVGAALLIVVVVLVSVAAVAMFNRLVVNEPQVVSPLSFTADEGLDRLVVATAQSGGDWGRVGLRLARMSSTGFGLCVGNAGDGTPSTLVNERAAPPCTAGPNRLTVIGRELVQPYSGSQKILAGQYLHFCGEQPATDVVVKAIDLGATATLGELRFAEVNACT